MASYIEVEGARYKVTESLGFHHGIGMYAKEVETPFGFKKVVKYPGRDATWRFWTADDRLRPLLESLRIAKAIETRRKSVVAAQYDYGYRGYTS